MGTPRPTAQVVRRDLSGLALSRVCFTPHNIRGLPPYSHFGEKLQPVDVLVLPISPNRIFDRRMS